MASAGRSTRIDIQGVYRKKCIATPFCEPLIYPTSFIKLAEHVLPLLLRSPAGPLFRHRFQLIDPTHEVLRGVAVTDLLISHVHTNRIRTRLRYAHVKKLGVGPLCIESVPGALIQSIAAVGVVTCQCDRRSGPALSRIGRTYTLKCPLVAWIRTLDGCRPGRRPGREK